jgi:amino acid transporter
MPEPTELKRSVSLPFLIFYGVGTMVGGGFYALLGKVAGEAGFFAPIALGLSGLFALLTGLSFGELVSRFPVSAGEVRYVTAGFNSRLLARVTGLMVILAGIVSSAALSVATIGFLQDFYSISTDLGIFLVVLAIGGVAAWGIGQSVGVITVITVIEVGALVYASVVAEGEFSQLTQNWQDFVPSWESGTWIGIFTASFLAFYAFLGFEDMVNIAEEAKDARRTVPVAIVVSVLITMALYVVVSLVALLSIPPAQLAASNTPVAEMVEGHGWYSNTGLGIVSLLAGLNGALVQVIMASRVSYGMAKQDQAPAWLGAVNPYTRTPVRATALVMGLVLILALFFPLTTLAKITSAIILVIFATANLALWRIKRRDPDPDGKGPRLPIWWPLLAFTACLFALAFQLWILLNPDS